MQTIIHSYYFVTDKPDQAAAYRELVSKLSDMGLRCFNVWGQDIGPSKEAEAARRHQRNIEALDGKPITLEAEHLFDNQWNTTECGRVFDWYEGIYPNVRVKAGHWLEQTDEMRAIRRDTLKCGYCGYQKPSTAGLTFCPDCLDSEYLKAEDLPLLRLLPCSTGIRHKVEPLTEAELAELLPRYHEAQGIGKTQRDEGRMSRARARIIEKRDQAPAKAAQMVKDAETEAAGMLWLLDHGFDISNAIYYTHTQKFGLGWSKPLASVPDFVTEFPFPYELKLADGRKLEAA